MQTKVLNTEIERVVGINRKEGDTRREIATKDGRTVLGFLSSETTSTRTGEEEEEAIGTSTSD
jgi:hypothetical protein